MAGSLNSQQMTLTRMIVREQQQPWTTPTAGDAAQATTARPSRAATGRTTEYLARQVVMGDWPTPNASLANDCEDVASFRARQQRLAEKHGNSNGAGTPLGIAVRDWPTPRNNTGPSLDAQHLSLDGAVKLWPTPVTNDARSGGRESLTEALVVRSTRWPTPVSSDANGSGNRSLPGNNAHAGESLSDALRPDRAKVVDVRKFGRETATPLANGVLIVGGPDDHSSKPADKWTTPTCRDAESPKKALRGAGSIARGQTQAVPLAVQTSVTMEIANGTLSPAWVEILQGLPEGWTLTGGPAQTVNFNPAWPAGRVQGLDGASPQYEWEPPRLCAPKSTPNRTQRLKALGNCVVPQQAVLAIGRLCAMRPARQGSLF